MIKIEKIIESVEKFDKTFQLPGMNELRQCGQYLLSYLDETDSQGVFALIEINDIERSYIYGGVDTNIKCWQDIIKLILAELPSQAYMGRVSAGIVIHAWGNNIEHQMQDTLTHIQSLITNNTLSFTAEGSVTHLRVSSRIGFLVYPDDCGKQVSFSDITRFVSLSCLDLDAKEINASIRRYHKSLALEVKKRRQLDERLYAAIGSRAFIMHFQPKFNIKTHKIIGAEALVRWTDSELGAVTPDVFVPALENTQNIIPFTIITIEKTISFVSENRAVLPPNFRFALNLSQSIFNWNHVDVVDMVTSSLEKFDCPPQLLEIELTESAYFNRHISEKVTAALTQLQKLGIKISIDDFGSGYGALSLITSSVASTIKIDKQVSSKLFNKQMSSNFLNCLIYSACQSGLTIVIEGIEEQWQEDMLVELNVTNGQGYFYSKPLSGEDFLDYLSQLCS